MDIGPKEKFSTTFQLFPSEGGRIQMNISFIENQSSIDVYYDKSLEILTPKGLAGKLLRKMMEKQRGYIEKSMDLTMIPLIKNCIQQTIRKLEEEKDSHMKETKAESQKDPMQILKIQFAEGKISEEEYLRKKKILED